MTTGKGMNLMAAPRPRQPEPDEDQPGHDGGHREPVQAVSLDDAVDDHHESAGRSADLHPRPAQRRDQKAGDDGGVEPALGRHPAGDGKGDRQRQRHDPDDHPGSDVGQELGPGVGLEGGDELRKEQVSGVG